MKILMDANTIVGLSEKSRRPVVANAIKKVRADGHDMFVVPQVIYEFWVVATRPAKKNGLGMSTERVVLLVGQILNMFKLLDDPGGIYGRWFDIVTAEKVLGKQAHDARLVAAMAVHGLDAIMTQNVGDFKRYGGIQIIDPRHATLA
jgi:predicted nucleic acid-binding protein